MNSNVIKTVALATLMTSGSILFAQPPGGGGGSGGPPPPVGAPIDGGAIALLVSVAGYSYTQLRQKSKK